MHILFIIIITSRKSSVSAVAYLLWGAMGRDREAYSFSCATIVYRQEEKEEKGEKGEKGEKNKVEDRIGWDEIGWKERIGR